MDTSLTDKQIQHLYWRTGFGISAPELQKAREFSKKEIVNNLFSESRQKTKLLLDFGALLKDPRDLSREERKELRKLRNQKLLELNIVWLKQLTETKQVLREKMTLFFHNHFAVRLKSPRAALHLNNIIRKHALENFGDMLMEVSKSPAMLLFLNNRQNRKNNPNENFAREVMELFTLGRDNGYTEEDIKEAARAFTGWNFNKSGSFVFRQKHHDFGSKTILGKTGNFKGEDVIKILLEQKQTAKYITEKIYQYFVNEKIKPTHLKELTDTFYSSNYNLEILMKKIFMSNWFYESHHIGIKIKSPIELIIGLSKPFCIKYKDPKVLIYLQRKMNQTLFLPPNVAGWPGGKSWIDNSTLMLRLKLASVTLNDGVIEWHDIDNMEATTMMRQKFYEKIKSQMQRRVKATPNWENYLVSLNNKKKEELIDFILQPKLSYGAKTVTNTLDSKNTKNFIIELMSLPEYQLC
ncbi:Uncharacterized conserved protein, DUF1800 family [Aquimarina amphilecti]|uniref:Uncharacterized conserved protein, DUF1800 family n=1 Tax=Aquimarina amphilecti TaxID=1038014 RepID=A0A1H7U6G8_AQUAM|nr:DUF1800 domain-containing protein [Aquimarina amphilecti]SEL92404.1 Uncharacterized conserved protein, DUF1800 family [Aquimarina amphilecti]